jgi:HEPN domain-containing protein
MAGRPQDWLRQAAHDLASARVALEAGIYEWACFASQQAAEKAVKAVYQALGADAWGHAVSSLLLALPDLLSPEQQDRVTPALVDLARELDRHYIPARYPDAHPEGAPFEFYTQADARRAVDQADQLLRLCTDLAAG